MRAKASFMAVDASLMRLEPYFMEVDASLMRDEVGKEESKTFEDNWERV